MTDLEILVGITTILFAILTTECSGVVLTLHKDKMTWSDARAVCLQDGGTLISDYRQQNVTDLMANVRTTVWEGRYYSPWVWLLGCYSYQDLPDYIEIKDNQMKNCVNHCNSTNYFGLQSKKCFCFDSFRGSFLRTADSCTYKCPGNKDERCGGESAIIIYMNDICYTNSTEWQGTVSQTRSGTPCLPWASIAEVNNTTEKHFPDGYAENASNFCRDPFNESKLSCYISQKKRENCDIPPCIEAANDGISSCMSFKKPKYKEFQFKQDSCQSCNNAVCAWDDWINCFLRKGTWKHARDLSRRYNSTFDGKKCKSLAGPRVFWLTRETSVKYNHWFGYFREVCTDSKTVPSRRPKKCFSLSKENEIITSRVEDCEIRNAFICQHAPLTCGEDFNEHMNSSFETPDYNEKRGYGAFHRCIWTITVPENYSITLLLDVSIEDTHECRSDFLKVFEGNYGTGELFCGETLKTINTIGSNVTVEFRSDGTMNEFPGVQVTWTAVPMTLSSGATELVTDSSSFTLEGGTLAGMIIGLVFVVSLVLGTVLCLIRRRKTSKNKERRNNATLDLKRNETNTTTRLTNGNTTDKDDGLSSEIHRNTANDVDNATEETHYDYSDTEYERSAERADVVKELSATYPKRDDHDARSEKTSEVYNTLNEATENQYQNHIELNVYNSFNDSQEVYDHTVTTQSKTRAIIASEMQTYDHLTDDNDAYAHTSTLQMK